MPRLFYIALFIISVLSLMGCSGSGSGAPIIVTQISGHVNLNGTGLDGVNVMLSGDATATTITKNFGEYKFGNLQAGNYTITIDSAGYNFLPTTKNVSLAIGEKAIADFVAEKVGIHVPEDAATIQLAIDMSTAGETIYVHDGIYKGAGNVALTFRGKPLTLRSKNGPGNCIIDCDGINQGFIFNNHENSSSILERFTIRHCTASFGAAIELLAASPSIIGNIFDSNVQGAGGFGAAIGGNGSSPIIDKNIFINNTCDSQFLSGVVSFVNSSSPIIINNILNNNTCRAINMTLPTGNSPRVINNTIINNVVGIYVDRRVNTLNQIYRNNIIVGNAKGLNVVFGTEANNPMWQNNLVYNNTVNYDGISDQTGLNGNISSDPLFANPAANLFRLQATSPCIDAGILTSAPAYDFDGTLRPQGSGIDIGAYEYH